MQVVEPFLGAMYQVVWVRRPRRVVALYREVVCCFKLVEAGAGTAFESLRILHHRHMGPVASGGAPGGAQSFGTYRRGGGVPFLTNVLFALPHI